MNATHRKAGQDAQQRPPAATQPAASSAPDQTRPEPGATPQTEANRGSPAAPVMKQFAKTKAESTGRP